MEFTEFGWRDALMLAVVAAVAYMAVSLLRLLRLSRARATTGSPAPAASMPAEAAPAVVEEGGDVQASPQFAEHLVERLAWSRLENELKDLRAEVTGLRASLSQLQEGLSQAEAARRISPLYADAAALAQRGYDARGIAGECGISVAEAELVLAMSDGSKNFDDEVDDGGSGQGEPVEPSGR